MDGMYTSSVEQYPLCESGLARVNVCRDSYVSDVRQIIARLWQFLKRQGAKVPAMSAFQERFSSTNLFTA